MNNIHVIPHTHWDREWYFNAEQSRALLFYFMEELLEALEKEEFKYFVLDGQAVILEDYLELKPEDKDRIKNFVTQGKLIIGPWYTQTDEMVVAGESIVRNLYYGIKKCEEFGPWMKIGYLPDSFGQSAQIPQILNGFGIEKAVFWRGLYEKYSSHSEFLWHSPDGSSVFAVNLPLGYAIGKYLPHDGEQARLRIKSIVDRISIRATSNNLLIPNGHDQMPVQTDLPHLIEEMNEIDKENNYIISNYDKYIDYVKNAQKEFDHVEGELIYPKYERVHRSIFSTRYDLKKANADIENLITGYVEPILSIAWSLGMPYPHGIIEKAFKEIMQNHAHDSIGCCNTDEVHKDVEARFKKAKDLLGGVLDLNIRKIAEAVEAKKEGIPLIVFNTLPYVRSGVFKETVYMPDEKFDIIDENGEKLEFDIISKEPVDMGTIDRRIASRNERLISNKYEAAVKVSGVPAIGYKTLYIVDKKEESTPVNIGEDNKIENKFFIVKANGNGTIDIYDKRNSRWLNGVMVFEDGSDDGDGYNYSPLREDFVLTSENSEAFVKSLKGKVTQRLNIIQTIKVPENLEYRKMKILNTDVNIETDVILNEESETIDVKVKILNNACDHRMRVLFKTNIASKEAFSDQQFGTIARPTKPEELELWEKEKWVEKPVPVYPMQSFVKLQDQQYGIAVITKGIREYEIVGQDLDTIAITLFRGIGHLGKPDLVNRPGRASGVDILTPDSQLLKELEFEFCIYPHKADSMHTKVSKMAKEYLTPMIWYKKTDYTVFIINKCRQQLPEKYSILSMDSDLVLSTVKKAEKEDALIVRAFNPSLEDINGGSIVFNKNIKSVSICNLKEDIEKSAEHKGNGFSIGSIKCCKFSTFMIK